MPRPEPPAVAPQLCFSYYHFWNESTANDFVFSSFLVLANFFVFFFPAMVCLLACGEDSGWAIGGANVNAPSRWTCLDFSLENYYLAGGKASDMRKAPAAQPIA